MTTDFRITGIPQYRETVSLAGAGEAIPAPGAGRRILIHDILATVDTTLTETSLGGAVIGYAGAGTSPLTASIAVDENVAVYVSAGSCTINYSNLRI